MTTLTFNPSLELLAPNPVLFSGDDALVYLTPILGPTSTLLIHRLASYVYFRTEQSGPPQGVIFDEDELAATFGVPPYLLRKSLARLVTFRALHITPFDNTWRIPRGMHINNQWRMRLPVYLQAGAAEYGTAA